MHQGIIKEKDLLEADEIFLTNAIYGIRWVQEYDQTSFSNSFTKSIYRKIELL